MMRTAPGVWQNAAGAVRAEKRELLTRKKRGDILKKYFGNALAAVCGVSRFSDNRTDERHRGSQLKVPKETGTFSRKNGPAVLFIFQKALFCPFHAYKSRSKQKLLCVKVR